ncbi:MAG: PPC domain-containing DNA-binding protein [Gammaproteobacteria bacterium]
MIVDSTSGKKVATTEKPFILALKMGEDLFAGILRCAEEADLKSASISGLGALDDVTVAYYNLNTKSYQTKLFAGMYELISLHGNITKLDGKHFIHIHAALGTEEYNVVGGHIMSATVGPSAEITVVPLSNTINRAYDEQTGLKLMCPLMA